MFADADTPVSIYRKVAGSRPGTFLLESAEQGGVWTRFSFVGAGSFGVLTERDGRARWVADEHWHSRQQGRFLADGRYELKVPYSVSRELLMDVLHYGSDAEIVEPQSLREQAKALLSLALSNYD